MISISSVVESREGDADFNAMEKEMLHPRIQADIAMVQLFVAGNLGQLMTNAVKNRTRKHAMLGKIVAAFLFLAMMIQVIKPFGVPGLRKRGDFWKIAVVAFVIWSVILLIRP